MTMTFFFVCLILAFIAVVVVKLLPSGQRHDRQPKNIYDKPNYLYGRKECVMTETELGCFDALTRAVGEPYYIFPQVHLDDIVYPKSFGKSYLYALRHINQKSVDFLVCAKDKLSPKLAIELDDSFHNRPDRQRRDREVERILADAHMPLLRLKDHTAFEDIEKLKMIIEEKIGVGMVGV